VPIVGLFILFLAVFQCAVALVVGLVAHVLTTPPKWRRLRGPAIRAALFAAIGSFLGGVVGYVIVAAGIGTEMAVPLMGGFYLAGFVFAGRHGWLRGHLSPDFESDPIG
jgi:hypothetical protein